MTSSPHIILFPFMSKGHMIPLLHLAKLIHNHRPQATFTIFTTPANEPFISHSLSSLPSDIVTVISLPFPATTNPELPLGVESTDKLPSMSLFHSFASATEQLQTGFETALEELQNRRKNITFLVSDGFLYWTQESASKFNIPRLFSYGMSSYARTICRLVTQHRIFDGLEAQDELIQVPDFPWVRVAKDDFESPFNEPEPKGPEFDFVVKCAIATSKSYGELVNSFYELEPKFLDYWNSKFEPKSWPIGPFCLADKPQSKPIQKRAWMEWLDLKQVEKKCILYVAFGSQAEISKEQLKEIAFGLEKSNVDFLWALRIKPNQEEALEGFEQSVKERGLVVRGWVEQRDVLVHESVQGFLSHCGWNSVTESICASVPILAWPMLAEQPLNARMVADEIKIGLRVETCDGLVKGLVKREALSKMVKKLMRGEEGKVVRKRVKELSEAANKAIEKGGSSWNNLESLLNELENIQVGPKCKNATLSKYENGVGNV